MLITNNRASMAIHLAAHAAAGRRHWRVFRIRGRTRIAQVVEALYLFWAASEAEEWVEQVDWIPF